jgi:hypothetical protein
MHCCVLDLAIKAMECDTTLHILAMSDLGAAIMDI